MSSKVLYKAIAYLRLSKDDGDESESNSIKNQRTLINDYVSRHSDIKLLEEKVDDGYSGVTFERPGFQEMMELVRAGKVNCVIVKDLSRFGRNFVESGKYIQQIFPFLNVRFIAINDNYDSLKADYQTSNLYVPIKNLFNDAYSRDVSIKMRSFYDYKKRNGHVTAPFAVYGYRIDKIAKKLIVDENVSGIIQSIYSAKLFGLSDRQIADKLNQQQVLCPSEYKKSLGLKYKTGFREKVSSKWSETTIRRILHNAVYTGRLEIGKTYRPNYKVKRPYGASKDSWIGYENAHEAIISKSEFNAVQRITSRKVQRGQSQNIPYPLSGLLFCHECRYSMVRRNVYKNGKPYVYYNCSGHKKNKKSCSSHNIREDKIKEMLLTVIQKHIEAVIEIEKELKYIDTMPERQGTVKNIDKQVKALEDELQKNLRFKQLAFEKYGEKVIDQKTYLEYTQIYSQKCADIEAALEKRKEELDAVLKNGAARHEWIRLFKENRNITSLNRPLLLTLIERIEVTKEKGLIVYFAHQDEYEIALEIIKEYKKKEDDTE